MRLLIAQGLSGGAYGDRDDGDHGDCGRGDGACCSPDRHRFARPPPPEEGGEDWPTPETAPTPLVLRQPPLRML